MVTFSQHYARGAQRESDEALSRVWVLMVEEVSKEVVAVCENYYHQSWCTV